MKKKNRTRLIQLLLFVLTLITTTFAGAEWINGSFFPYNMSWQDFVRGLSFSLPFLITLTVHEFGHYLTSKYYNVKVTLPYYIPLWFGFIGLPSIGTMGAFIRIKEAIASRKIFFDIGIAGPLAGFVVALGVLYYGFTNLPPEDYVYSIHPDYHIFGEEYEEYVYDLDTVIFKKDLQHLDQEVLNQLPDSIVYQPEAALKLGKNLLFVFFENYVTDTPELVPNPYEIIHYPWLFAGYLALFFTALNLIPIGQLDGGHVLYGLVGAKKQKIISAVLFVAFVFYAGLGVIDPHDFTGETTFGIPSHFLYIILYILFLYYIFFSISVQPRTRLLFALSVFTAQYLLSFIVADIEGYNGWLLFAFLIGRFLGVYHPPTPVNEPLDWKRQLLGWIALAIFILSFTPQLMVMD